VKRGLFIALTALPVLLALATLVLWLRSYRVNDFICYRVPTMPPPWGVSWAFISNRGCIKLGRQEDDIPTPAGLHHQEHEPTPWTDAKTRWHRLGFAHNVELNQQIEGFTIHYETILFPHWFVILLLMAIPVGAGRHGSSRSQARGRGIAGAVAAGVVVSGRCQYRRVAH
jgi:hypothetical protein